MLVICLLTFAVNVGNIPFLTKESIEGVVLKEGDTKYLVDFRNGLKKYPKTVSPHAYDKVLIDKTDCVKED